MDARIRIRRMSRGHLAIYRQWFESPSVWSRMIYPDDAWFDFVSGAHSRCWSALDPGGRMVGVIQIDAEDQLRAYLSFAVAPDQRGQGHGSRMLRRVLAGPARGLREIETWVDDDNLAALRCLHACGFERGQQVKPPSQPPYVLLTWRARSSS